MTSSTPSRYPNPEDLRRVRGEGSREPNYVDTLTWVRRSAQLSRWMQAHATRGRLLAAVPALLALAGCQPMEEPTGVDRHGLSMPPGLCISITHEDTRFFDDFHPQDSASENNPLIGAGFTGLEDGHLNLESHGRWVIAGTPLPRLVLQADFTAEDVSGDLSEPGGVLIANLGGKVPIRNVPIQLDTRFRLTEDGLVRVTLNNASEPTAQDVYVFEGGPTELFGQRLRTNFDQREAIRDETDVLWALVACEDLLASGTLDSSLVPPDAD